MEKPDETEKSYCKLSCQVNRIFMGQGLSSGDGAKIVVTRNRRLGGSFAASVRRNFMYVDPIARPCIAQKAATSFRAA